MQHHPVAHRAVPPPPEAMPPAIPPPVRRRGPEGPEPQPKPGSPAPMARRSATRIVVVAALFLAVMIAMIWAGGKVLALSSGLWATRLPTALEPETVERFETARVAAAAAGIDLVINSGWRSEETQQELFDEAVAKYGSYDEAKRWVLPPEESAHVWGTAVDVGPAAGAKWLAKRGSQFGLCIRYVNEPWHFETLTEWGEPCPAPSADAASSTEQASAALPVSVPLPVSTCGMTARHPSR